MNDEPVSIGSDPSLPSFMAVDVHGAMGVVLVDYWPDGNLKAQLDRIEAKLDVLLERTHHLTARSS